MKIGQSIKYFRKEISQKTQKDFCKTMGISQTYLSQVEAGKKNPSDKLIKRIADKLNVPVPLLYLHCLEEKDVLEHKRPIWKLVVPVIDKFIKILYT